MLNNLIQYTIEYHIESGDYCVNQTGVEGTLTVPPGDVLALTGSIARLRCSTDYSSPVYWDRVLFGSDEQETIYYGKNGMVRVAGDRFSVDGDSTRGRYDLVIRNVQLEDAGMYRCIDDAGIGEAYRAELVVSGKTLFYG